MRSGRRWGESRRCWRSSAAPGSRSVTARAPTSRRGFHRTGWCRRAASRSAARRGRPGAGWWSPCGAWRSPRWRGTPTVGTRSACSMADPATSEQRTRAPTGSRRGHLLFYLFFTVLAGPISDVVTGRTRSSWLAGSVLAAFVACFVLLVELGRHPGAPGPAEPVSPRNRRINRVLFVVLIVLAISATMGFGRGWQVLNLFVVAASAFSVPTRWAPVAIAGIAAIAVSVELGNGGSLSSAASGALGIGVSGFLSLLLRGRARRAGGARAPAPVGDHEGARPSPGTLPDLLAHSLTLFAPKPQLAGRRL